MVPGRCAGVDGRPVEPRLKLAGGTFPQEECKIARLYRATHPIVASVTSVAFFHSPRKSMSSLLQRLFGDSAAALSYESTLLSKERTDPVKSPRCPAMARPLGLTRFDGQGR